MYIHIYIYVYIYSIYVTKAARKPSVQPFAEPSRQPSLPASSAAFLSLAQPENGSLMNVSSDMNDTSDVSDKI